MGRVGDEQTNGVEFCTRFLAATCIAGGNVDFCAVRNEAFGDHAANSFPAAGNEDHFVLDGEECRDIHYLWLG